MIPAALPSRPTFAVLVVSCDRYADLWKPFFHLMERYWRTRSLPVYLVTNNATPVFRGVRTIATGPDRSWSDTVKVALRSVPEDYVLMWLEDLFLCGPIDQARVDAILEWAAQHRPDHIRLNPTERPYAPHDALLGRVPAGAPYRTTTVLSLWRKDVLNSLLAEGENAWQFELDGTVRSDSFNEFYSAHSRCFPVVNGVIRGRWQRSALRRLTRLGAPVDRAARPIMTVRQAAAFKMQAIRARLFKLVPWQYRRSLRRLHPI